MDISPRTNGGGHGVDGPRAPSRVIVRKRALPGGRAVAGGLLVAVAAVLTFAAYARAGARPRQAYVVAAHDLAPGDRITAGDLKTVALDVPDAAVRRDVFSSPAVLIGASVISPIDAGALVEASAVVGRGGAPGTRELSLAVDPSRAVGGTLKRGEFVDVLGTFGTGATSYTAVMAAHVEILRVSTQGNVGTSATDVVILAVPDETSAEALADAGAAVPFTLVRSAEQAPDAPSTSAPVYRPPTGTGHP